MLSVALIDDDGVLANAVANDIPDGEEISLIGNLAKPRTLLFMRPGSWVVRNATNQVITLLPPDYADNQIELPVGRLRTVKVGMEKIELSAPPEPPAVLKAPDPSPTVAELPADDGAGEDTKSE